MAKAKKIGDYEIPFNKLNGNLLNYSGDETSSRIEWKENFIFEETMTIDSLARGRSAAHFIVSDSTEKRYTLFMKDMLELVQNPNATIKGGVVSGKWTFQKRGDNYGVRFYE